MQITEALQQAIERFSAFQSGGQRHHYPRHLKLAVISLMTHYPLEFLSGHLSVSQARRAVTVCASAIVSP